MTNRIVLATALASGALAVMADSGTPDRFLPLEQPVRNTRHVTMPAQSSVFTTQKAARMRVPDDGREYKTVLEEDFSRMTAGSPEDPDPTFINDEYNMIPSSYTHTPGWGGRSVMQAGGAVCIGMYTDPWTGTVMTGQLETPELDLHRNQGTAYLSFRAKTLAPDLFDMVCVRWVAETDMLPVTGDEQTFPINGLQWTNIEVELTGCPSNTVIQFYSDSYEIVIDDIKVQQFRPEIEAPTALKWTDFTGDSFTANWTAVEGADHYIFNCYYVRRAGTEDQLPDYKYVARDIVTTETSYHLENLNRDKVYYYYIRAVSETGVKSEESALVEVLDLTVPDGIVISDVSAEGFLVEWDPVYNAEGYGFQAILDHKAMTDETYDILNENFDAIVNPGSIGEPYTNAIGLYDMDSFGMSRANWVMYEGGVINGAIALHNYESSFGTQYYGELVSPIMTIGQSTGNLTIEADFATLDQGVHPYIQIAVPGVVDGETKWVLGAGGEIKQNIGSDWTHVKLNYKVNPGLIRFSFGTTDGGWLYMDNLRISVDLPEGAVQRNLYKYDEIKEGLDAPGYYCSTADRQRGDHYSFALMAARQRPGSYMIPVYVLSDWTETFQVPDNIEWSGIESVAATATPEATFTVTTEAGAIAITNPAGEQLTVFNADGRTAGRTAASSALMYLRPGFYIVSSASGAAVKVVIR